MKDFLSYLERELISLWNYLYRFLCHILDQDVNEDWIVTGPVE